MQSARKTSLSIKQFARDEKYANQAVCQEDKFISEAVCQEESLPVKQSARKINWQ